MKEKTLFILNPRAGNGRTGKLLPKLKSVLKNDIHSTEIAETEYKNHATKLVKALQADFGRIIVVGGDGTLNEALNGINGDFKTILGVIPAGSGNDFAKTAGMTGNFENDVKTALNHTFFRDIDYGEIEFSENGTKTKTRRRFINSAGIGFDALVSDFKNKSSRFQGLSQYILAVIKALRSFHYIHVSADFGRIKDSGDKILIAISNGKTYGGGIKVNPSAEIDDGFLDACLVNPMSVGKVLFNLPRFVSGRHGNLKEIKIVRFTQAELLINKGAYIHADGEVIASGAHSISIQAHQKKLRFIVNTQ